MTFSTAESAFHFRPGTRPLLISMPHVGTHVPLADMTLDHGVKRAHAGRVLFELRIHLTGTR